MSKAGGRMTAKSTRPQSFVVADSTFELEIEDVADIRRGIYSDNIQLLELSNATWSVGVEQDFEDEDYTNFTIAVRDFPEELKSKSQAVLSVLCGGEKVDLSHESGYIDNLLPQICYYSLTSNFEKYYVENAITFTFRLMITCEGIPVLRNKFYDPLAAKKSLIRGVANMCDDPIFSDFTFIVGGQEFKVHRNILAAVSPVMRRLFTANLKEAKQKKCTIDAVTADTFGHLLRFIYNADIPEDLAAVAIPLYEAAHYYEIEKLEQICAREIHENLSSDNAMEVYEWAQPYDLDLKANAWTIIKRDILKIFVELKDEPLPFEKIKVIIKQREQEKTFWEELEAEIVKEVEKASLSD